MAISERFRRLFLAQLAKRDIVPEQIDSANYQISLGDATVRINIENKSREFVETKDESIISHFVETIAAYRDIKPKSWAAARDRVYFSAAPSFFNFHNACITEVTEQVTLVLVCLSDPGNHIVWLMPPVLEELGVSRELAEAHATDNLARLLAETPIKRDTLDGHPIVTFNTKSPLKATLIFARGLREKIEPIIGWPVYAILPNRDSVHLFPESARGLFQTLGAFVIGEYTSQGYPITTEIFHIDTEPKVIGSIQSPLNPPKGMIAVQRDSVLTFFLPKTWTHDEDEGQPFFYEPPNKERYLLVSTQVGELKPGVDPDEILKMLAGMAEMRHTHVEKWPGDRAIIRYEMIDEGQSIFCLVLTGPVKPGVLATVVFTDYVPQADAELAEVRARRKMLNEMLPRSVFRPDGAVRPADLEE